MDKALSVLLEANTCDDLFKSLKLLINEVELSTLLRTRINFDEFLEIMLREYKQDTKIDELTKIGSPDYMYVVLAILSIALGDAYIHRFALRFARIYRHKILSNLDDESLTRFGNKLGIRLEFSRSKCFKELHDSITKENLITTICYRYRLYLVDYLNSVKKLLTEEPWKLSSTIVDKGFVYLENKEKILRILSEHIYTLVSSRLRNIKTFCEDGETIKQRLLNILREFDSEIIKSIDKFMQSSIQIGEITQGIGIKMTTDIKNMKEIAKISDVKGLVNLAQKLFPPCIRDLIEILMQGENLSHHQRFALATFLINYGVDVEIVLKLFSYSPDFNEKIARYQIEHLAGLRGSRKKYLVYSCNTMKTLGMCKAECGIKNPLLYPRRAMTSYASSSKQE
ncbi:MAG: hypothetical protein QXZ41_02105 [Ignisphaera sp.]|uniref:DNA primase large subunit PriL n=1 Tax=Ignisphaera aggregans TaxID=334771 RepID=A0A7C4JK75_9CREN